MLTQTTPQFALFVWYLFCLFSSVCLSPCVLDSLCFSFPALCSVLLHCLIFVHIFYWHLDIWTHWGKGWVLDLCWALGQGCGMSLLICWLGGSLSFITWKMNICCIIMYARSPNQIVLAHGCYVVSPFTGRQIYLTPMHHKSGKNKLWYLTQVCFPVGLVWGVWNLVSEIEIHPNEPAEAI